MKSNLSIFGLGAIMSLSICMSAQAANFKLKGLSLGLSAAKACGTAKVTSEYDDIINENKAAAPLLIKMDTTECDVEYASFAGSKLAGPAYLRFMNDALILAKFKLSGVPVTLYTDIYQSLTESYGKSKRTWSRPFVTHTWKQQGETLILEMTERDWNDNDVIIILRQDAGDRIYETRHKANRIELKKLGERQIKNDMH